MSKPAIGVKGSPTSLDSWNGIRNEIFFVYFLAYLSPVCLEINLEWRFLIFWIFLLFFWECSGLEGTELRTIFFFFLVGLFLSLSQPSLVRNKARMMFFNFLIFFAIFLGALQLGLGETVSRTKFFLCLYLPIPARSCVKWRQKYVFNFFELFSYIFFNFFKILQPESGRNCTRYEIFLSLFQPIPALFR